jgi:polysaccharide export outer membrane protein
MFAAADRTRSARRERNGGKIVKFLSRAACVVLIALSIAGCVNPPPRQAAAPASANAAASQEYRLGIGDVISIRVYGGDEEMRFERVRLNDRDPLTLPFGQFKAYGQTTREIEAAILKSVQGRLLVNPRVWVNIDEYRPFFVQGQVARPGAYPFQPGLNVIKAVTIAGGFRERASQEKIFIVREGDKTGSPLKAELNTAVHPGDMVSVQESFF